MNRAQPLSVLVIAAALASTPPAAQAAAAAGAAASSRPSAELRAFLQGEMREVATGVQAIVVALASADWKALESSAVKIRDSYLAHQQLPEALREELERSLPEGFHAIDAAFHDRADRLAKAAVARDADLAVVQFYRLTEACIACHSQYAPYRFDGFGAEESHNHRH